MKAFISWSGPRSRLLAEALRGWIHDVIQSVDCFCSTDDIRAGQRWNNEVNTWLSDTDFGVICVTPENMRAPWLNFEAGAIAKRLGDHTRVVPVTLGFEPSALDEPLKQFNGVPADERGFLALVKSIAEVAQSEIDVERTFGRWWDELKSMLEEIPESDDQVTRPEPPDVTEMFTDIMSTIRGLSSDVRNAYRGDATSTMEYRAAAMMLAENDNLRDDIIAGLPGAIRYLRKHSSSEALHSNRSKIEARHARLRDDLRREDASALAAAEAAEALFAQQVADESKP